MRQSWTAALLIATACGGEVNPSGDTVRAQAGGHGGSGGLGTNAVGGNGGRGEGSVAGTGAGGAPGGPLSSGKYTGEPGVELLDGHTCAHAPLPPGLPIAWSDCSSAADCTARAHGKCVGEFTHECKSTSGHWDPEYDRGLPCEPFVRHMQPVEPRCGDGVCFQLVVGTCIYDACSSDVECDAEERCSCDPRGNRCVPAQCHGDSDCPAGEQCASVPSICYPEIGAYACTTPEDTCEPQQSCQGTEEGGWCMPWQGTWECVNHTCR